MPPWVAVAMGYHGLDPCPAGTEAIDDWLHVPAVIRTIQVLFQKNLLPVRTTPTSATGKTRQAERVFF